MNGNSQRREELNVKLFMMCVQDLIGIIIFSLVFKVLGIIITALGLCCIFLIDNETWRQLISKEPFERIFKTKLREPKTAKWYETNAKNYRRLSYWLAVLSILLFCVFILTLKEPTLNISFFILMVSCLIFHIFSAKADRQFTSKALKLRSEQDSSNITRTEQKEG